MRASRVSVTVLVDDYTGFTRGLLAEHGFAALIEVWYGNRVYRILFDTGQSGDVLLHNASKLGIDLGNLQAIVLSHRHYDHTGGLLKVLKAVGQTPVIAHPRAFSGGIYVGNGVVRLDAGFPHDVRKVEELTRIIKVRSPMPIAPGTYFLGEVPRVTEFETVKNFYRVENGELVEDDLPDDTALAIVVEDFGTVVVTGCSHAGIVNIVKHAERVAGEPVRVVVGGLHLASASEARVRRVAEELSRAGVLELHVGHCTGFEAECILKSKYGEKFRKIHVGYGISFQSAP